jgi:hypothetical protein
MYSVTRLLDVIGEERDRVLTSVRSGAKVTQAHHTLVEPTLPGSRNGGDVLVHLRFNSRRDWLSAADDFAVVLQDPAITRINGVTYPGTPASHAGAGTVYRALLLRVLPDTDPSTLARFEDELSSMARYIPAIRTWQLSRVDEAIGTSQYLMHPIHWAVVDRWFDPECPEVIIRDRVCHSFCHCDESILIQGQISAD